MTARGLPLRRVVSGSPLSAIAYALPHFVKCPRRVVPLGDTRVRHAFACLIVVALALPLHAPALAAASCEYHSATPLRSPVTSHSVYVLRSRCSDMIGTTAVTLQTDLVRFAESTPAGDRILVHLELQSLHMRYASGRETSEHFVVLKDSAGTLGYNEVESYEDASGGACSGRFTVYKGSQSAKLATTDAPCTGLLDVLG